MSIIEDYISNIPVEVDCHNIALLTAVLNRQPGEVKDIPENLIHNFIAVGYVYLTQKGYSLTVFGQVIFDDYCKRQKEADQKKLEIEELTAKTLTSDNLITAIIQAIQPKIPVKTAQGNISPLFNQQNLSCLYVSVLGFLMATRKDLHYNELPPITFALLEGELRPIVPIAQEALTVLRTIQIHQLNPVSPIIASAVKDIVECYIPNIGSIQKRNEYQILSRHLVNGSAPKRLNPKHLAAYYETLYNQHNKSIRQAVEYNTPQAK